MPRISEEHRERRRQQILDAAQICFSRKGFHETSLQEIFAESGLSAGAVYRYFKSKDELVRAIAERSQPVVVAVLEDFLTRDVMPPLDEIVERFADAVVERMGVGGPVTVAPQGWALATYHQAVRDCVASLYLNTRSCWVRVAERLKDDGRLPAGSDPFAVGVLLTAALPGFILQRLLFGDVAPATLSSAIRSLVGAEAAIAHA
ncbi:TetR/AcrR family transcriptional regulator [Actinomadura barringtoniae]|uniref:TetR/AcrR family transcriptional regulator n=1 Tax=Actinomadura barringtoniae TaxID=1427535 RepID=A0A939PPW6_9ACTN|nr:TetR/AcrR family transcriptional regulator [Actinomadura barringtoniae]MBO2453034.1 TetR/AcrR family transcriptional regulator [Actinomadura barringtoniae]